MVFSHCRPGSRASNVLDRNATPSIGPTRSVLAGVSDGIRASVAGEMCGLGNVMYSVRDLAARSVSGAMSQIKLNDEGLRKLVSLVWAYAPERMEKLLMDPKWHPGLPGPNAMDWAQA